MTFKVAVVGFDDDAAWPLLTLALCYCLARLRWSECPKRSFVADAANGKSEPTTVDAANCADGRNGWVAVIHRSFLVALYVLSLGVCNRI